MIVSAKIATTAARHIAGSAAFTWLAGLGLHAGYGVSVPFLGTWVAAFGGLMVIGHIVHAAAEGFHLSKLGTLDATVKAAMQAGTAVASQALEIASKDAGL